MGLEYHLVEIRFGPGGSRCVYIDPSDPAHLFQFGIDGIFARWC